MRAITSKKVELRYSICENSSFADDNADRTTFVSQSKSSLQNRKTRQVNNLSSSNASLIENGATFVTGAKTVMGSKDYHKFNKDRSDNRTGLQTAALNQFRSEPY